MKNTISRAIKFRVWKPKHNPPQFEYDGGWVEDHLNEHFVHGVPEYSIFQQFTGLKDSAGREIYEGDVVSCFVLQNEWRGTVTWEHNGFWINFDDGGGMALSSMEWKILGNIFENTK